MDKTNITEQLVADKHFIRWVCHPDPELDAYWQNWLYKHPGCRAAAEEAREIILSMQFGDDLHEEEIHAEWDRLQSVILKNQSAVSDGLQLPRKVITWKKHLGIAACIVFLLAAAWWLTGPSTGTLYTTGNGEQQRIELPDGSFVILNSNSSLLFKQSWGRSIPRKVTIKGEAFFSVTHTTDHKPFSVHTEDGMLVEVLGTEFNVYERTGLQRVVLNSGNVRLQYKALQDQTPILMEPGEMVIRQGPGESPEKRQVNASRYSSWTKGKLVFENTPIAEVCRVIKDNFGIIIAPADTLLNKRSFNGTFPANDPEILLKTLMTMYNLEPDRP